MDIGQDFVGEFILYLNFKAKRHIEETRLILNVKKQG